MAVRVFGSYFYLYGYLAVILVNLYSNRTHYRCNKEAPVLVENVPMVEFHAGGMGDNQVRLLNN